MLHCQRHYFLGAVFTALSGLLIFACGPAKKKGSAPSVVASGKSMSDSLSTSTDDPKDIDCQWTQITKNTVMVSGVCSTTKDLLNASALAIPLGAAPAPKAATLAVMVAGKALLASQFSYDRVARIVTVNAGGGPMPKGSPLSVSFVGLSQEASARTIDTPSFAFDTGYVCVTPNTPGLTVVLQKSGALGQPAAETLQLAIACGQGSLISCEDKNFPSTLAGIVLSENLSVGDIDAFTTHASLLMRRPGPEWDAVTTPCPKPVVETRELPLQEWHAISGKATVTFHRPGDDGKLTADVQLEDMTMQVSAETAAINPAQQGQTLAPLIHLPAVPVQ